MLEPPQAGRGGVVPDRGYDQDRGDPPGTSTPRLAAGQEARAVLPERLEHIGGKVDHWGLLCHRQAVRAIVVRVCHVAACTSREADTWHHICRGGVRRCQHRCRGGVRRPLTTSGSGARPQCRMGSRPPLLLLHDAALVAIYRNRHSAYHQRAVGDRLVCRSHADGRAADPQHRAPQHTHTWTPEPTIPAGDRGAAAPHGGDTRQQQAVSDCHCRTARRCLATVPSRGGITLRAGRRSGTCYSADT